MNKKKHKNNHNRSVSLPPNYAQLTQFQSEHLLVCSFLLLRFQVFSPVQKWTWAFLCHPKLNLCLIVVVLLPLPATETPDLRLHRFGACENNIDCHHQFTFIWIIGLVVDQIWACYWLNFVPLRTFFGYQNYSKFQMLLWAHQNEVAWWISKQLEMVCMTDMAIFSRFFLWIGKCPPL